MKRARIVTPSSVREAISALAGTEGARPMAGGTDLLVQARGGAQEPPLLVSLHLLDELRGIELEGQRLSLGATVTVAELASSEVVLERAPLLSEAARLMASPPVRSRATLGGNLSNASPAADLAPPLLVHEASALLQGPSGERRIPVSELLTGPGETSRRPDELLTSVEVPLLDPSAGTAVEKAQTSVCGDLSIVSASVAVVLEDGVSRLVRIALGAVAPTAIRAEAAERKLEGSRLEPELLDEASGLAIGCSCPIDDVRASADYRCRLLRALLPRALRRAAERAR